MAEKNVTHGHSRKSGNTPTYNTWLSMRSRVRGTDGNAKTIRNYVERGINVCERWESFENFLADMGERPEGKTLDRWPDVNGNYELGNCRWATWAEQNKNQRSTRYIEYQGETLCLKDWAKKLGIKYQTLHERLQRGWTVEKAFTITPSYRNSGLRLRTGLEARRRPVKTKAALATHCELRHEFTPNNTRYTSSGKPLCKTCERAAARKRVGWPADKIWMPPVPHGFRPVMATGYRKRTGGRRSRSAS